MKMNEVLVNTDEPMNMKISLSKLLDKKIVDIHCHLYNSGDDDDNPDVYISPSEIVFEDGAKLYIWQEHDSMWLDFGWFRKRVKRPPKRFLNRLFRKVRFG